MGDIDRDRMKIRMGVLMEVLMGRKWISEGYNQPTDI
jgi:hypothetical protein